MKKKMTEVHLSAEVLLSRLSLNIDKKHLLYLFYVSMRVSKQSNRIIRQMWYALLLHIFALD